jgi:3-oxoacyl-[acyl-carrier-protein] synthase-3
MVDTNDEWILSRTGISERLLKLQKRNFLPCNSGKDLIQRQHKSEEIDLIIMATTTPDLPVASTGVYVSQIGTVNAFAFDLQAACSGFLFGMSTAAAYIESGKYKKYF